MLTFHKSKWFAQGRGGAEIEVVVLHTTESSGDAEATARYNANRNEKVSAHYYVDNDSIVQGVLLANTAYAAPPTNRYGIQIEQCGFARWSERQWLDEHLGTLCGTARILAHIFRRFDIPIIPVDASGLKAHHKGTTTHAWVNQAFHKSSHWDPGPGYPLDKVMQLAWEFVRQGNEDIESQ